jgi:fluoroacetyl-CoA thioesterase
MTAPRPGQTAELTHVVADADTAVSLGSGEVPVLATPRLLAWMEAATVGALADSLADTETSIGTRTELDHMAPSPVGARVTIRAVVAAVDGRRVRFEAVATDAGGKVVAHGQITRVVVDRARFLGRAAGDTS